jgi:MFS transporter, DHA1 family, multidrug resistance protein
MREGHLSCHITDIQLKHFVKNNPIGCLRNNLHRSFGLANVEAIFGLYVNVKYGFTPKDISVVITVGALMGVLIQALLIGRVLQRFKEQQVINVCLFLTAASLVLMLSSGNFWYILTVTLFFCSFVSALRPPINSLLSKIAGNEQGFVAGMNNAYTSLGIIIGPAVAGILFDIHIDLPYIFGAFVILVSLLVSIFWPKDESLARAAPRWCRDR